MVCCVRYPRNQIGELQAWHYQDSKLNQPVVTASSFTPKKAFTGEDQTEVNHFYHQSDEETKLAGVWECAPYRSVIKSYPVNELMTIVHGSVTVTEKGKPAETFTAGDTFFISKGTECVWEITKTVRKFYFISD